MKPIIVLNGREWMAALAASPVIPFEPEPELEPIEDEPTGESIYLSRYFAHDHGEPCHCAGPRGCYAYGETIIELLFQMWWGKPGEYAD